MAITNISRDWGVNPSIVRIVSTDSFSTIAADGYITSQANAIKSINSGDFQWATNDAVLVQYSDNQHALFTISADFSTLNPMPLTPTTQQAAYVVGFLYARVSATTATVQPGFTRSDAGYPINIDEETTLNIATVGLNGYVATPGDLPSEVNLLEILAAADSSGEQPSGYFVINTPTPVFPDGYDQFKRIGWMLVDNSGSDQGVILQSFYSGTGGTRHFEVDSPITVLTAEGNATFQDLDLTAGEGIIVGSAINLTARLVITFSPDTPGNLAYLRVKGSANATPPYQYGEVTSQIIDIPVSAAGLIQWKTTSADDELTISQLGFTEGIDTVEV